MRHRDLTLIESGTSDSGFAGTSPTSSSHASLGLLVVVVLSGCFIGASFNRYVSPTSGGEAALITMGQSYLPYRDYFLQAPPGVPMLVRAIASLAGPHLVATLAFGALLRLAAACALYGLLLTIGRPSFAVLATLCALMVSSTDISDTPFYYNHIGAALIVSGAYLGFLGSRGATLWHLIAAAGCGVLLTFAVAVKQTMVFGVAGALLAMIVLTLPRPAGSWAAWLLAIAAGAAAVVGSVWLWLAAHDLFASFVFVMTQAPQSKGGIGRAMLRPIFQLPTLLVEGTATGLAWILIGAVTVMLVRFRQNPRGRTDPIVLLMALGVWGLIAVFLYGKFVTMFLTAIGWWGSLAIAVVGVAAARRTPLDAVDRARIALGLLSFSIGYCFAVSWPLFENLAFPGLAVVVIVLLELAPASTSRQWMSAIVVLSVATMVFSVYRKIDAPYSWGLWAEPPLYATRGDFEDPVLAGMHLSQPASDLYRLTRDVTRAATHPDDPIFVFPNLPILYAIANRRPATYALAHWVDTCPDFLGKQDARVLRTRPPKLMIVRQDEIGIVENEERLYRGGLRSSVRDVIDAVKELSPGYDSVAVFKSEAGAPIEFLVRRD
jgi:hypothetical protein